MLLLFFRKVAKALSSIRLHLAHVLTVTFSLIIGLAIFLFHQYNQNVLALDQIIESNLLTTTKMQHYSDLITLIRSRTNLASQILTSNDVFQQDELKQEFDSFATKFAQRFTQLSKLPLEPYESEYFQQQKVYIIETLPLLQRAIALSIDGSAENRQIAAAIFYDSVIPGQNALISVFQKMITMHQNNMEDIATVTHAELHESIYNDHMLALITGILVTLIAILAIRWTYSVQSKLSTYQQSLEIQVQQRTIELATARDQAEQASRAKSEFLSSMSHELRTPLNAILGFAQILSYDDRLDEQQHDNANEIIHAGHHLLELISDVLDLARIESGKFNLTMEEVNVDDIISESISLISADATKRCVSILPYQFSGYAIYADRVRLKQVILNLISNAVKYNHQGGCIKIDIDLVANSNLRITVTDTGIGIPKDKQHELFIPFNRIETAGGSIEGTGIGLAITRRLVEDMGGEIGFESQDKIGSRFWVVLPIVTESMTNTDHTTTASRTGTNN